MPIPRAMLESEIVTSPTLKPKKACRTEERMSVESSPQGARTRTAAARNRTSRVAPVARTEIWLSERLRRPVLAWSVVASRVSSLSARPTKMSTLWTSR